MLSIILCRRMLRTGYNEKKLWTRSFVTCSIKSRRQITYREEVLSHILTRTLIYPAIGIRVIFLIYIFYLHKIL